MIKRVIWSIFLRPSYSFFVIFLFFIMGSLMLLGLSWNNSAENEILSARNKWGLKAIVQVNAKNLFEAKANSKSDKNKVPSSHLGGTNELERFLPSQVAPLTMKLADEVSTLTEVKSAQYISVINTIGNNFSPVIPASSKKSSLLTSEGISEPQFQLIGVLKSEVLDEFKSRKYTLISGSDISPADLNTNNAIVELGLADKNQLKMGDSFELASIDGKYSEIFVVSGIFISGIAQNTGLAGQLSFLSDKNQIFTSVTAVSALSGGVEDNPIIDKAIFTLKSPESYENFRFKAMEKGVNLTFYDIYTNDSQYKNATIPLVKMTSMGTGLTLTIMIFVFVITFGILIFIRKKRSEEIQTLLFYGESNRFVFTQFLIEIIFLILIGFILAIVASPITLVETTKFIKEVNSIIHENSSNNIVREGRYFVDNYRTSTNVENVFSSLGISLKQELFDQVGLLLIGLFLCANASILALSRVLRMSKRNLLMDSDLEEST